MADQYKHATALKNLFDGKSALVKTLKIKNWFTKFTAIMVVLSLLFSFSNYIDTARYRLNNAQASWLSSLDLVFRGVLDKDKFVDTLANDVLFSAEPVAKFFGYEKQLGQDISRLKNLLKSWLELIDPVLQYEFDNRGFVHRFKSDKFLTDDLEVFFTQLPSLIEETVILKNDFWVYGILARLVGKFQWVELVEEIISAANGLAQNKSVILNILGAQTTQRLVIFNQNTGEARPTGGFIGSYIPIDISRGRVNIGQSQSIYFVNGNKPDSFFVHPASWNYNLDKDFYEPSDLLNINFSPCFTTTASFLEREFSKSFSGYSIDQVVFITPYFLTKLLPPDYRLEVEQDLVINSINILNEIERLTSIESDDPTNPKVKLAKILDSLFNTFPEIVNEVGIVNIFKVFLSSLQTRDIQWWPKDNKTQKLLRDIGISSEQTCGPAIQNKSKSVLTPLLANISGDKRNLVTSNDFNIFAEPDAQGWKIKLRYKQTIPENPNLQRGFNSLTPFTFFGVQLPQGAQNIQISSPQVMKQPFLRPFYQVGVTEFFGKPLYITDEIDTIIKTSRELSSDNSGGFTYSQVDGSKVVGIYFKDELVSYVDVSFHLSNQDSTFMFYNQPGLERTSLSLGKNLGWDIENSKIVTDYELLGKGLELRIVNDL